MLRWILIIERVITIIIQAQRCEHFISPSLFQCDWGSCDQFIFQSPESNILLPSCDEDTSVEFIHNHSLNIKITQLPWHQLYFLKFSQLREIICKNQITTLEIFTSNQQTLWIFKMASETNLPYFPHWWFEWQNHSCCMHIPYYNLSLSLWCAWLSGCFTGESWVMWATCCDEMFIPNTVLFNVILMLEIEPLVSCLHIHSNQNIGCRVHNLIRMPWVPLVWETQWTEPRTHTYHLLQPHNRIWLQLVRSLCQLYLAHPK